MIIDKEKHTVTIAIPTPTDQGYCSGYCRFYSHESCLLELSVTIGHHYIMKPSMNCPRYNCWDIDVSITLKIPDILVDGGCNNKCPLNKRACILGLHQNKMISSNSKIMIPGVSCPRYK